MRTAILGLLAGSAVFIYGFSRHDQNQMHHFIANQEMHYFADHRRSEQKAYALGILGSAIMTVSVKHLWNQRKPVTQKRPINKFRETLQLMTGLGLVAIGMETHDLGAHYDQTLTHPKFTNLTATDHHKETLGFLVGMVGTTLATSASKEFWKHR